jgi:hypothetical protein
MGKHKNRRRARIERPANGTETWRSSTRRGPSGGGLDGFYHGARRSRGGRGRYGSDDYQIPVIEPWGCYSTRYS